MMKTLVISALMLISAVCAADTIVNNSNKASPATVLAKSFEKAVGEDKIEFFQASSCEEADQKFNSTANSVMTYNVDVGIAALTKKLNCPLKATADNTVFIGKSYIKICSSAKTPFVKSIEKAKTIGVASVALSKGLIADYSSISPGIKGVPYGGSKDVLMAVIAGDIDVGFIGVGVADPAIEQGQIVCTLSTDPRRDDYIGKKYKMKYPAYNITSIFYTNSNDKALVAKLQKSTDDPEFQTFLRKSGFGFVKNKNITADDVSDVQKHISDIYNLYWKE